MSRRDTIIVAVLVNAALLMILFATAIRSDQPKSAKQALKPQLAEASKELPPCFEDDFLDEYVSSVPTLAETMQDELVFAEESVLAYEPSSIEQASISAPIAKPVETPAPARQEKTDKFVNITVKKGDFLEKIAKANNTTVSKIMTLNNISSTQLKIGQILKVPLSEGKAKTDIPAPLSGSQEYYIVREGDNPWLIASRNHLKLDELLRLNDLDEQKARRLRPGDKLRIR